MVQITEALVEALETIPGVDFSGLFGFGLIVALLISYLIYLGISVLILSVSLKILGTKKVEYGQVLMAVLVRDVVSVATLFIPFGIGTAVALVVWVGLIKYIFKLDWGKSIMVAIIAELIPLGVVIVLFALGIIGLLFFA